MGVIAIATIYDWSVTASANTSVGGTNIAEGCPAANLNDAVRQVMAIVRATFDADVRFASNLAVGIADAGVYRLKVVAEVAGNSMAAIQNASPSGYSGFHFLNSDGAIIAHVGYANATAVKHAGKAYAGSTSPIPFVLTTADEERVHIDGNGVVCIKTQNIPASGMLRVACSAGAPYALSTYHTSNYTAMQFARDVSGTSTEQGTITVSDFGTSYNNTSDRRLKRNIIPAGEAGEVIDALEIVSFDKGAVHVDFGLIAQDAHKVLPLAVTPGDDGDEVSRPWQMDNAHYVPALLKEVQSLRRRVAELEAR